MDYINEMTPDNTLMLRVRKKPIVIHAIQIVHPFEVKSLEGTVKGKAGDYLMIGVNGERYICDRDIFNKTYDIVEDEVPAVEEEARDEFGLSASFKQAVAAVMSQERIEVPSGNNANAIAGVEVPENNATDHLGSSLVTLLTPEETKEVLIDIIKENNR